MLFVVDKYAVYSIIGDAGYLRGFFVLRYNNEVNFSHYGPILLAKMAMHGLLLKF